VNGNGSNGSEQGILAPVRAHELISA
jgi:hypothetical protein